MHELGITRNIVAIVADAAQGRRVTRIHLEVGKLSGIMAQAIAFCFEVVCKESPIDGAALSIHEVEGRARCRACDAEFAMPTLFTPCGCGSRDLVRTAGEELKITTMELEEAA